MNSLLHNPFTDLGLGTFLLIFAACEVVGLLAGSLWIWLCDGTRDDDLPADSSEQADPYETAFLRGGVNGVARLAIDELRERGYLERPRRGWLVIGRARLRRSASPPDLAALTAPGRAAWEWLSVPRSVTRLLDRRSGVPTLIGPVCRAYEARLSERRFLETSGRKTARELVRWGISVAIVGPGLYRLGAMAISGGDDLPPLMLLLVAGLVCTAIVCRPKRLSDLGSRYLENLEVESGERDQAIGRSASQREDDISEPTRLVERPLRKPTSKKTSLIRT